MNDKTIQMIAEAILANTRVLQSLVDSLPKEAKQAVAERVEAPTVTPIPAPAQPVAPAPAPVVEAAPAPVQMPAVVQAVAANAMPAPPTFAPPPAAPVAAPAQAVQLPFSDKNGLTQYVLDTYKALGPQKGMGIQKIMETMSLRNINDILPEQFVQFYQAVEQLKASA